jgi:hypothetical protein
MFEKKEKCVRQWDFIKTKEIKTVYPPTAGQCMFTIIKRNCAMTRF